MTNNVMLHMLCIYFLIKLNRADFGFLFLYTLGTKKKKKKISKESMIGVITQAEKRFFG